MNKLISITRMRAITKEIRFAILLVAINAAAPDIGTEPIASSSPLAIWLIPIMKPARFGEGFPTFSFSAFTTLSTTFMLANIFVKSVTKRQ
ncbi:hypothetical protein PspKH34_05470 [Parageobacillus sp. KH3-4]|nr:hypothetical protein PspKH34_05470 [Parageobacillus sp. KH3-4]